MVSPWLPTPLYYATTFPYTDDTTWEPVAYYYSAKNYVEQIYGDLFTHYAIQLPSTDTGKSLTHEMYLERTKYFWDNYPGEHVMPPLVLARLCFHLLGVTPDTPVWEPEQDRESVTQNTIRDNGSLPLEIPVNDSRWEDRIKDEDFSFTPDGLPFPSPETQPTTPETEQPETPIDTGTGGVDLSKLTDLMDESINRVVDVVGDLEETIKDSILENLKGSTQYLDDLIRQIKDGMNSELKDIISRQDEILSSIGDVIGESMETIGNIVDGIKNMVSGVLGDVGDILEGIIREMKDSLHGILDSIINTLDNLLNPLVEILSDIRDFYKNFWIEARKFRDETGELLDTYLTKSLQFDENAMFGGMEKYLDRMLNAMIKLEGKLPSESKAVCK